MSKKFTSTVFGASLLITIIGIITKGIGFVREMIFANNFGLSWEYDVFLVSAALPIIIYTTITYLGQNYIIPIYNKINHDNLNIKEEFINKNFWYFFIIGWLIFIFLYFVSDTIIDLYLGNSSREVKETASNLFRIFILTIPLSSGSSVLSAFFHSEYEFGYPAFSRLTTNIVIVLILFLFSGLWNIYVLPLSFVFGMFIQLVYLFSMSKIKLNISFKIPFGHQQKYTFITSSLILTVLIEVITLSYILVDRYFFNELGEGGIASLSYANSIFVLPISIFSFGLSTVLFPKFAKSFTLNKTEELENNFKSGVKAIVFIFIPMVIIFITFGDIIIEHLFQRGKFSSNDTLITFNILILFSISLIFYAAYSIINKMLYGTRLLKHLLLLSIIGILIKTSLNFVLVNDYQQYGLAVSTSIAYTFLFLGGYIIVVFKLRFKQKHFIFNNILFNIINALISFTLSSIIIESLFDRSLLSSIFAGFIFLILYFLNSYLIKTEEIKILGRILNSINSKSL
jgi:putative peptidoglycan lipid II flippase